MSSAPGRFIVQLSAGSHRVEVAELGYQRFLGEVLVRDEQTATLNVTLVAASRE